MRQQQQTNPILSLATAVLLLAVAWWIFQNAQRGGVVVITQPSGGAVQQQTQPETAVSAPVQQQGAGETTVSQPSGGGMVGSDPNVGGGVGLPDLVQQLDPQTAVNAVQLPSIEAAATAVFQAACNEAAAAGRRGSPKCANNRPVATPAAVGR